MNAEETEAFKNKEIAQLIAAIPFLAKCDNPERTALNHLASYVLSIRVATKPYYNCVKNDHSGKDITKRLETISHFTGGDKAILDKGMNIITLNMIADYERDQEEDKISGKYNPVSDGILNYEKEKKK